MKAQRTIVQLALVDETGDSYYRMRWPAAQLAQFEPSWRIINVAANAKERFEWAEKADLLIIYQSADLELLPLIEARRLRGRKTLVEYNDNFYSPQPWSPVVNDWSSPLLWQSYEALLTAADALLVTGPGLRALFAEKFPEVKIHILENLFPHDPPPFSEVFAPVQAGPVLGWGGSLGHMADLLAVVPSLQELIAETPGLQIHLMGNKAIPELCHFPADRFHFTAWGSVHEYYRFWKPVHIGIAPLLDSDYNRCRSDIKAVEMAALGVLPLLPDALPYRTFLEETGLQPFHSFNELKERIAAYVLKPERLRDDAERCYRYVVAKRLGSLDRTRLQVYSQYISGKPDAYDWPVGAGYHELIGTPSDKSGIQETLAVADSFIKLRQPQDALRAIEHHLKSNAAVPELALAHLKVQKHLNLPEVMDRLEQYSTRFPGDLRFHLLFAQWARNSAELSHAWAKIIFRLRAEKPAYREFFRSNVLKLFHVIAQVNPELLASQAEALLEIYPESSELRFFLGQIYERQGNFRAALEHFNWLREARRLSVPNNAALQNLEPGYLEAWSSALEARIRGQ